MKTIPGSVLLALAVLVGTAGAAVPSTGVDPQTAKLVEQALRARGYTAAPASGSWDDASSRALEQFQRAQGLEPTGHPDPRTLAMLGIEPTNSPR